MSTVRHEDGFSLIELLVAMALATVVFIATMSILIVYSHGSAASSERTNAQDLARATIDLISQQLRNIASPLTSPKLIERANSYDLVFQTIGTPSGSNTTGAERVRYCLPNDTGGGKASLEEMYSQTQTWTTSSAPSIPWSSTACPDTSPSGSSGSYSVVVPYLMNRYKQATNPVWYYNNTTSPPSDLNDITSVQMDLMINPTPTVTSAQAELRSGVYLRNQLQAPVASFNAQPTGNGGVLLDAGSAYSPDGEYLSYSWSCTSSVCPSSSTLTGATDALLFWNPGAGTYTVKLTVTDPTGLTDTISQQVTVT